MAVSLERRTGAVAFFYWLWDGIDRTIFTAIKFSFPARFVSPFGFLGNAYIYRVYYTWSFRCASHVLLSTYFR